MDEILDKLAGLLPDLPPHLRRATRTILDRPQDVAITSMRSLAARANVTPPTMLRLARRAGFENYEAFRAVFQQAVTRGGFGPKAQSLQALGARRGEAGIVQRMLQAATDNAARSLHEDQAADLIRAAGLLRRAPAAYALGGGALHGMSVYLEYLSRTVLPKLRVPPTNGNSQVEGLVGVEKGDVVVILSAAPYATQMIASARLGRSRGARVIGISDSRGSPIAPYCDVLLVAGTASPQFYPSMVGIVAIVETLIALVVSKGDKATLGRIAALDRLRRDEGGYLEL